MAQAATAIFERQGNGGCLLFNASKGTFNPGASFGPYNLPKTTVIALMRQCAIELGSMHVRSNAINADRIRTGIYKNGLLEKRAKARGLSVTDYVSGNLLQEEVLAKMWHAALCIWRCLKKQLVRYCLSMGAMQRPSQDRSTIFYEPFSISPFQDKMPTNFSSSSKTGRQDIL